MEKIPMIESPAPSKFEQWKRPLIGGILSVLLFALALNVRVGDHGNAFFLGSFLAPSLLLGITNIAFYTPIAVLFWFIVGSVIAHFTKSNMRAVGLWLGIYILGLIILFIRYLRSV